MVSLATRALLMSALLGCVSGASVRAQEAGVAYEEIVRVPLALGDKPGKVSLSYVAIPGSGYAALPSDLAFEVLMGDRKIVLPVAADGTLQMPIREDWVAAGARVISNQPAGRVGLTTRWEYRAPLASGDRKKLDMTLLGRAGEDFDAVLANMPVGMRLTGWLLLFERPGATVRIVSADGTAEPIEVGADGRLRVDRSRIVRGARIESDVPLRTIAPDVTPLPRARG